eukprot:CCRYP_007444-RA/>CCRYP_007444-RA protein AED:0.01 eAED:0.01 QI:1342/1/1/1/1/1/2/614/1403
MDSDDDDDDEVEDEEWSERAFLERLAQRQREQARMLRSPLEVSTVEDRGRCVGDALGGEEESVGGMYTQDTVGGGHNRTLDGDRFDGDSMSFAETQPWEKDLARSMNPTRQFLDSTNETHWDSTVVNSTALVANPYPNTGAVARNNDSNNHGNTAAPHTNHATHDNASNSKPPHIPKISFEQLKQPREITAQQQTNSNAHNTNGIWQEEALRSSLLDLIHSFPNVNKNNNNNNTTPIDHDHASPSSTTSAQTLASNHLARKRCFDAASRALARLAIISRQSTRNEEEEDPCSRRNDDCNPPSPRSLPSFMSVMNVHWEEDRWRGSEERTCLESCHVFSGRSVHGQNARTVCLWRGWDESKKKGNGMRGWGPVESWNLEELIFGAVQLAAEICRDATSGGSHRVGQSPALVESSLEFMATAFACVESDLVYSMLLLPLPSNGRTSTKLTLFDVLSSLAPHSDREASCSTIAKLSFLALSRGLEATTFVARYATSLDPSACCAAYASPYSIMCPADHDRWIDEGGVGWLSAMGRDLGLHLESDQGSRLVRLNEIARYAYDSILDFNPVISDGNSRSLYETVPCHGRKDNERRSRHNESLHVDTEVGNGDDFQCRQPSVVKDRMYAAHVEFLHSMIQIGVVSGWLTIQASGGGDLNASHPTRSVEKLCQKLFLVIETRSRLRRSTNQSTAVSDPGDSESVCAASLSLLLLALPRHEDRTASSSISFRQMGGTAGTIADIVQSPLVKRMVELGLSPNDDGQKDPAASTQQHALASIYYVLSDIVLAGGASLISSTFGQQLNDFLLRCVTRICKYDSGRESSRTNGANIDALLLFLLHLHKGCPVVVRQALRIHFEHSLDGAGDDISATRFVGNLLQMCAYRSFSVSTLASSLLRSLLRGNPIDDTPDVLSDIMMQSFETDFVMSTVDIAFHSLVESTCSLDHNQISLCFSRHLPRACSLSDVLSECLSSSNLMQVMLSTLSASFRDKSVMDAVVDVVGLNQDRFDTADTLFLSAIMSILYLLRKISLHPFDHDNERIAQLKLTNEKFGVTLKGAGVVIIESAMVQGTSADLTHRALKYQNSLTTSEKTLALTFTRTRNSLKRDKELLRSKIRKAESEIVELSAQNKRSELEREKLSSAMHEQTAFYEKKLELVRFEAQSIAKCSAEIHIHERRRAEQHSLKNERLYHEEKELRASTEQQNKSLELEATRLRQELSSRMSNIAELQKLLEIERREKQEYAVALEANRRELKLTSEELEKGARTQSELQTKLSSCEKAILDLTSVNKDLEVTLEETCEKLINLASIYQTKEAEMDKYKAELRSAVNAANKNADIAISKYEASRNEAKSLRKELDNAKAELREFQAHRAEVQRLRKNAPTSYINQLRNDPRVQTQPRKSRSGKENSFNGR